MWGFVEVPDGASQVEKILVGPADDGQGFGIPTLAASMSGVDPSKVTTFLLRAQVDPNSGTVFQRFCRVGSSFPAIQAGTTSVWVLAGEVPLLLQ